MMQKIQLNTKKIKRELKRQGKTQSWLAEQLGVSRQAVSHVLRVGSIRKAGEISAILGIDDPKDLIISKRV